MEGMKLKSLFHHLLPLLHSVRTSKHHYFSCLWFILYHDLRQYQHVKDDPTDCSHHAVSCVWQAEGSEKLRGEWDSRGARGRLWKMKLSFVNLYVQWEHVVLLVQYHSGESPLLLYVGWTRARGAPICPHRPPHRPSLPSCLGGWAAGPSPPGLPSPWLLAGLIHREAAVGYQHWRARWFLGFLPPGFAAGWLHSPLKLLALPPRVPSTASGFWQLSPGMTFMPGRWQFLAILGPGVHCHPL